MFEKITSQNIKNLLFDEKNILNFSKRREILLLGQGISLRQKKYKLNLKEKESYGTTKSRPRTNR